MFRVVLFVLLVIVTVVVLRVLHFLRGTFARETQSDTRSPFMNRASLPLNEATYLLQQDVTCHEMLAIFGMHEHANKEKQYAS